MELEDWMIEYNTKSMNLSGIDRDLLHKLRIQVAILVFLEVQASEIKSKSDNLSF